MQYDAPFVPELSKDIFDVSNFDDQFTGEDAVNSVIPDSKMRVVQNFKNDFTDFK